MRKELFFLLIIIVSLVSIGVTFLLFKVKPEEEKVLEEINSLLLEQDRKYSQIINDPVKLAHERSIMLKGAKDWCNKLLLMYDYELLSNGNETKEAIKLAKKSLDDGSIEDGVPRAVACIYNAKNKTLRVYWLESDFDTKSIIFQGKNNSKIANRPFSTTDMQRLTWFSYFHWLAGKCTIIDIPEGKEVIKENESPLTTVTGIECYIPTIDSLVYIVDRAGNVSNKLSILIVE
ncbi:MAG: hypothetical protein ACYTBP_05240 [Planctomycetota bacterium]